MRTYPTIPEALLPQSLDKCTLLANAFAAELLGEPTVTNEERFVARILFVNRILRSNGTAFQHLLWSVLRATYGQEFVEVRPQGSRGDGGNDGYLPCDGHYFQIYGPIDPAEKVTTAVAKLADDFEKIRVHWNQITPMRAYSFAFNDKYEGTFVEIAQALGELENGCPGVRCRPYTAAHLEEAFMGLKAETMQGVLGSLLPDPSRITRIKYGVLREVVDHIMASPAVSTPTRFGDLPDLLDKIHINNLCSAWSDLIRNGARQAGHIESYFAKNSSFMRQRLREHLVDNYRRARDTIASVRCVPSGISREDLVFEAFRSYLLPADATVATAGVVDALIGYYFEACDVFDPHAAKGAPNASP